MTREEGDVKRIIEHDRKRAKRLILFVPASIVILVLILISLERTQVVKKIFMVGYEGPPRFVPEITIIDEKSIESEETAREREAMMVRDVTFESEELEKPDDAGDQPGVKSRDIEEQTLSGDLENEDLYRSYATHAKVPYREDYVILKMIKPVYPPEAIENGWEGYVLVEAYVNEDGDVVSAWITSAYGPKVFEVASLEAVQSFLFKAAMENGKPVPFWVSFLIRFELRP
jgi:TonB family protein